MSEGDFGNWKFTSMSREGDQWRIGFTNSGAEDGDVMTFAFADECVDESGGIRSEWAEAVNNAVFRWEGEMRGDENGDDPGD